MKCKVCNQDIEKGKRYKTEQYISYYFCSQDCYEKFLSQRNQPKSKINFKPDKGSQRRRFTDYLQDWTDDKINWPMAMKQAKDIQEEYELSWHDMLMVLKYAREYDNYVWHLNYGLYQVFYVNFLNFVQALNAKGNISQKVRYIFLKKLILF